MTIAQAQSPEEARQLGIPAWQIEAMFGGGGGGPIAVPSIPNQIPLPPAAPAERTGMFGIKGTMRDVIGALGDAFLVQAGKDPVYRAQRAKEQQQDMMRGFLDDPAAAIRRIAETDPALAWQMQGELANREAAAAKARREGTAGELDISKGQAEKDTRTAEVLSDMYQSGNPTTWPQLKAQMERYAKTRGYEMPAALPDTYDPNFSVNNWALTADQERQARQQIARLEDYDLDRSSREGVASANRDAAMERTQVTQAGQTGRTVISETGRNVRHVTPRAAAQPATGSSRVAGLPPRPPQKVGDTARSPTHGQFISYDGKTWSKPRK